jgi:hypothetical protein
MHSGHLERASLAAAAGPQPIERSVAEVAHLEVAKPHRLPDAEADALGFAQQRREARSRPVLDDHVVRVGDPEAGTASPPTELDVAAGAKPRIEEADAVEDLAADEEVRRRAEALFDVARLSKKAGAVHALGEGGGWTRPRHLHAPRHARKVAQGLKAPRQPIWAGAAVHVGERDGGALRYLEGRVARGVGALAREQLQRAQLQAFGGHHVVYRSIFGAIVDEDHLELGSGQSLRGEALDERAHIVTAVPDRDYNADLRPTSRAHRGIVCKSPRSGDVRADR